MSEKIEGKVCEALKIVLPNNVYSMGPMRMSGLQLIEYAKYLDELSKQGQDTIKEILDKIPARGEGEKKHE